MDRNAGILMPVASLPNRIGLGDFGKDAYRFVDDIAKAGFSIWQILPLNPLGFGNSPYQPFSSFAIDELYISLDLLEEEGLLNHVPDYLKDLKFIAYNDIRRYKDEYLHQAFENFVPDEDYEAFIQQKWLKDYALFMSLKKKNHLICWIEWETKERDLPKSENPSLKPYEKQISYQYFVQYIVLKQWKKLKEYANSKGILIMGDIPFYVGLDSAECWSGRPNFLLDKDGYPRFIAGVPPDYFSASGQRWGNPIYDWEYMEKDGFSFWLSRLGYNKDLFDIIRLDHFRAFDTYWKIPASCPTAIEGEWIEAPGHKFFDTLFEKYPDIDIVAEDLGDLRPEVLMLRDDYHFPGMNVLQFTFDPLTENKVDENCLAYTGTHDNDTIRSIYHGKSEADKRRWRKWFKDHGYEGKNVCEKFLNFALQCDAGMVIIPMADWLYLGPEGCINHPGTIGSPDWEWRLPSLAPFEAKTAEIRDMISRAHRLPGKKEA
ncbi:MAG: 4-alpha-glucanotransferase [Solobacterium sp.]|nr:4-alpha-glucanotransferase [Solobacterium sp.]